MENDPDDEFIPHPTTVAKLRADLLGLEDSLNNRILTLQALELALQDHLRYRKNIIAYIKRLQAIKFADLSANINMQIVKRDKATEEIGDHLDMMEETRESILNVVHGRTCTQVELAFAEGRV